MYINLYLFIYIYQYINICICICTYKCMSVSEFIGVCFPITVPKEFCGQEINTKKQPSKINSAKNLHPNSATICF